MPHVTFSEGGSTGVGNRSPKVRVERCTIFTFEPQAKLALECSGKSREVNVRSKFAIFIQGMLLVELVVDLLT